MAEVILSDELNSYYDDSTQVIGDERDKGKITQLQQEELSPVDYKTQAFLMGLGGFIGDFYAGNFLQGVGKLSFSIFMLPYCSFIAPIISIGSLWELSSGTYVDGDGKAIRQVVQLKKEEMSYCDQETAFFLCCIGLSGIGGIHQFYAGKPLKGVVMLCTFGGCGVWTGINIYQLVTCNFRDGEEKVIAPDYIKLSAED